MLRERILGILMLTLVLAFRAGAAQTAVPDPGTSTSITSCAAATVALSRTMEHGGLAAITQDSANPPSTISQSLAKLTELAWRRPPCTAALVMRGIFAWRLVGSSAVPHEGAGQRVGISWEEAAVRDFVAAADARSGVASSDGAVLAGQALLWPGLKGRELVDEVGPGLITALAIPGDAPDSTREFVRGQLAAWLWRPAVADSMFVAYRLAGGNAGMAALQLARIRLATGGPGADTLYYLAAASTDSAVQAGILADIALIADSATLDSLRSATGDRAEVLRRFWESRDVQSLRDHGSRLREHYRRIGYALAHYRLRTYPRRYETYELWRNPVAAFDDRGLIYVRHGAPDDSAAAIGLGACPNVTWVYRRPDGNLVFHFAARTDPDDWRLVETLYNVGGENGPVSNRLRRQWDSCNPIDGLFESRINIDPVYGRLAVRPSRLDAEDELRLTTRSRLVGTTTDSYELRFAHRLSASLQAYGLFGDTRSKGRLLLVTTAPLAQLALDADSIAALHLHLVATRGTEAVERDTLRQLRVRGAPDARIVLAQELPVAAGRWNVGFVIRGGDSTGQYFRDTAIVVPAAGPLAVSDIVLAQEHGGLPWTARDGTLGLNALGAYAAGEPIVLYYESSAPAGPLRTELAVQDDRHTVHLSFSESAADGISPARRTVQTRGLRPGTLTITVTLTDIAGNTASRTVTARLLPPALPGRRR